MLKEKKNDNCKLREKKQVSVVYAYACKMQNATGLSATKDLHVDSES